MKQSVAELGGRDDRVHFKTAQTFDPVLFAAFHRFHSSIENNASPLEQQSQFDACLGLLARECLESPTARRTGSIGSASVRRAKDYIHERFRWNISLRELESAAGVSRFHLVRAFKREVGVTPHAFQIQLKLAAARNLLRKGVSIADSAAAVGFSDQSHFSRFFKEFCGVTPGSYIAAARPNVVFPSLRRHAI